MSVSQEGYRSFGHMCCGLWDHRRNPAAKLKIGILLIAIGLIWLGAKAGLLDFSWFQGIHFWPAVVILLGVWMVCKGFMQRKTRTIDKKTKEV